MTLLHVDFAYVTIIRIDGVTFGDQARAAAIGCV